MSFLDRALKSKVISSALPNQMRLFLQRNVTSAAKLPLYST